MSLATKTVSIQLQPRDIQVFRGLFESRMMSLAHAASLFFAGRYEAAMKRMQALKNAGYVADRWKKVGDQSILYLTRKAFDLLTQQGQINDLPSLTPEQFAKRVQIKESTLAHELQVMDVRVALSNVITASGTHQITEFTTWPLLSQFVAHHPVTGKRLIVQPDGFVRIAPTDGTPPYSFFLELDRSTEAQRVLADRALCYRQFYARGGFAQRCGAKPEHFKQHPFRVLMVLQNAERRNNTAERLMNCSPPVKFQTWLTTFSELKADPLGSIWVSPMDYHNATAGTEYEPHKRKHLTTYVRRSNREELVEERIVRRTLFEDAAVSVQPSLPIADQVPDKPYFPFLPPPLPPLPWLGGAGFFSGGLSCRLRRHLSLRHRRLWPVRPTAWVWPGACRAAGLSYYLAPALPAASGASLPFP